jgi:Carboxypeptidase regulatory-like domain
MEAVMRTELIGCVVFVILALGIQARLLGQAVTGTLLGTVLDSTGAAVPNANVTLTNEGTGVSNHMPTGPQGFYTFPTLDPGRYSVAVSASGFKTTVAKGNLVQVEQSTRVDVTLSPGTVDQQVTVTGQNPLVETTTSDLRGNRRRRRRQNVSARHLLQVWALPARLRGSGGVDEPGPEAPRVS